MNFKDLLLRAQNGDTQATYIIMEIYKPLLLRESNINGVFDEDMYQELSLTLVRCIRRFRITPPEL